MKNSTLTNFPECQHVRDYNLSVEENGFKVNFSWTNCCPKGFFKKTPEEKSKISNYLLIVLLFLFTNFLFAQQPACNLNGILEAQRLRDGGQNFTINSEVLGAIPGSVYRWEFKSNNSQASFVSQNGLPSMTISPGNKNGNFNLKLTIINPPSSRGAGKTCSCTKSVSIGSLQ